MACKKNTLLFAFTLSCMGGAMHAATGSEAEPIPAALQSPINIDHSKIKIQERNLPDIQFNYPGAMQFDLSFTGHTIQATVSKTDAHGNDQIASIGFKNDEASTAKKYNLVQIHMHAPSEHMIDHKRYPLEWHFVHQNPDDKSRLVIGVFMEDGEQTTPAYRTLLDTLRENVTEQNENDHTPHALGSCSFSPRALIPEDQRCWRYDGSLTSKPYTPVYWCVVRAKTTIDQEDLENLFIAMQVNTRGLQEVGNREVLFDMLSDNPKIAAGQTSNSVSKLVTPAPVKFAPRHRGYRGRSYRHSLRRGEV